jgi:maleylacetoacetate isomerase
VRAVLNLKGVPYETVPVDLVAGDQKTDAYAALNPGKGVPTLVLDDGTALTQSLAIIDYLDATYRDPNMMSDDAAIRCRMLEVALYVAADIHPVNNLRVVGLIKQRFGADAEAAKAWMQHWMIEGLQAVEGLIPDDKPFVHSDTPGLADLCITAQVYNAHRWGVDLKPFPKIADLEKRCLAIPAIEAAHPDNQPDAERK